MRNIYVEECHNGIVMNGPPELFESFRLDGYRARKITGTALSMNVFDNGARVKPGKALLGSAAASALGGVIVEAIKRTTGL
jgi:hypothetical protein